SPLEQLFASGTLSVYDAADNLRQQTRGGYGSGDGGTGWQAVTGTFAYGVLNRPISAELASGAKSTPPSRGFTIPTNNPVVTHTQYDALDRVLWEFDPNGNATAYTYSAFDEVLRVQEGGTAAKTNNQADFNIMPVGFLRTTNYTYDDVGELET